MPAALGEFLPAGCCPPGWASWRPSGLVDSTARVVPDCLFVARKGVAVDGRAYIGDAFAKGAGAAVADLSDGYVPAPAVADRVLDVPGLAGRLGDMAAAWHGVDYPPCVAITGTDGKTSTSWFFAQLWQRLQGPAGVVGTLGAGIWRPQGLSRPLENSTPGVLEMHELLAGMAAQGATAVAMEATSIGLHQGRLDAVPVSAAAWTSFGRDHIDYHGSRRRYFACKRRLAERPGLRHLVVWTDQRPLAALAHRLRRQGKVRVWRLRGGEPAGDGRRDCWLSQARREGDAWQARLLVPGAGEIGLQVATPAPHDLRNFATALVLVHCLGGDIRAAAKLGSRLLRPKGRMQEIGAGRGGGRPRVWVDFAHTPQSLESALASLRQSFPGDRVWCVFGCGGDRDRSKRPQMGAVAARLAERAWIADDNPRTEDPAAIRAGILAGVPAAARGRMADCGDRALAIRAAISEAPRGTQVLIAGKGHEDYQSQGGRALRFSDAEVAAEALRVGGGGA